MRKTLHRDFERPNDAGDQQEDKVPAHTIQKGESSGQQHHVLVLADDAEEPEEYDWYVPAVSQSLASACPVLMQNPPHQSYLPRSHSSRADRPSIAKLCTHFPSAMLRTLDLDDPQAFELLSS
jgi:hypothetical protein